MVTEVIDHADHIVEVALTSLGLDVLGKCELPPITHLPLGPQVPRPNSMRTTDQRRNGSRFPPSSDSGDIVISLTRCIPVCLGERRTHAVLTACGWDTAFLPKRHPQRAGQGRQEGNKKATDGTESNRAETNSSSDLEPNPEPDGSTELPPRSTKPKVTGSNPVGRAGLPDDSPLRLPYRDR